MRAPDGAVHFSRLKLIAESACHYHENIGPEESPSLRKGTGLHSYLIGNPKRIAVCDIRRDGRTETFRTFLKEHHGQDILSRAEFEDVQSMRAAIERHPRAMELLEGEREQPIDWRYMGRRCKGTPDVYVPNVRLVELKTTKTTNPRKALGEMRRMFYHCQLAWYAEGLRRNGVVCPEKYVVAVASKAPWLVVVFRVTPRTIGVGDRILRLWMEELKGCEIAKRWPGYSDSDVEFDVGDEMGTGLFKDGVEIELEDLDTFEAA